MSEQASHMPRGGRSFRGRYTQPLPTSNSDELFLDMPEFEPYDDEGDFVPRSQPPTDDGYGFLSVQSIDMCLAHNRQEHNTSDYDNPHLVVRRCQMFQIKVTFNRQVTPNDDFQLEFCIGSHPVANKESLVVVPFSGRSGGTWTGEILENNGATCVLGVTPSVKAIIGKYRCYVAVAGHNGMHRSPRNPSSDMYVIFNPWSPNDVVYMSDDASRREYVLNDYGVMYQGSANAVGRRTWMYGQFERGILDACIYLLDMSHMPINDRSNAIKIVRSGSGMINAQDENGVVVGNWSEDFSMGTPPTMWTGSVKILQQFTHTGTPVSFGQCWVFGGVFNTFLRCLGIPARPITNFSSAHDNTGNMKCDLIFRPDGTPDERNTRDSIWNYHVWNEVWMSRPDLPAGMGGWQAVDATPQETSGGLYQCGPAPVAAIKEGLVCHPYDCPFVFAEVNSDVVMYKRTKYGTVSPWRVDTTHIGQYICTQAMGSTSPQDITHTYKYPEGSAGDKRCMATAEGYGCERDHSELPPSQVTASIHCDPVSLDQDFTLALTFRNDSNVTTNIKSKLVGQVCFYTGVVAHRFKKETIALTIEAHKTETVYVKVQAQEYMIHLKSQLMLNFVLTGQAGDQTLSALHVVNLLTPQLNIEVSSRAKVRNELFVTVKFTNPFRFNMEDVQICLEAAGIMEVRSKFFGEIVSGASIQWTEVCVPRLAGHRCIIASLDSSTVKQVYGTHDLDVSQ